MPISRRTFLSGSATTTIAATAAATLAPLLPTSEHSIAHAASTAAAPSPELIALHRMAYGPRPEDIGHVTGMGLTAYIDEQLNPTAIDDSACDTRLVDARLKIKYDADAMGRFPAVNEARPLVNLNKSTAELWELTKGTIPWAERTRPFEEVRVATWLRAVYSKRQLFEVLVEFWHNHFNVNASSDSAIAATFPAYDKIIRTNALGNFRTFVEAIGRSTAMMYYLDNVSNRSGGGEGGNENYARELIELHTLGSDNYLKFYDDRRNIGTVTYNGETFARGYIDDDVYETARSLTGWTIANGHWERPTLNTGEFYYDASWHDSYAKTVLSPDGFPNIPRSQPDLKDGQDVYTILARHVGTARSICTKLCRRLIADYPPASVIDAAVATWMANRDAPDQIKQVVRTILTSDEFKNSWGLKIKRPFEALAAYLRATSAQMPVDFVSLDPAKPNDGALWSGFHWNFSASGHRIFEWPTPTGHPDLTSYWASTNGLLRRWNMPYVVAQSWGGGVTVDIKGQTDLSASCTAIVDFWIGRLCGFEIDPAAREALIAFLAQGGDVNQAPKPLSKAPDWNSADAVVDRVVCMVQLLASTPDFSLR